MRMLNELLCNFVYSHVPVMYIILCQYVHTLLVITKIKHNSKKTGRYRIRIAEFDFKI